VETWGAKLASEVENIKSVNSILIGHACNNPLVAEVKSVSDCESGYEPNVGFIEAYEFPNGKVSIVITGYSVDDTYNAARVLSFYGYYKSSLKGNKVKVLKINDRLEVKSYSESNKIKSNDFETKPKIPQTKIAVKDFSEGYFKIGALIFIILVLVLLGLIFRKNPKTKQKKLRKV
jgi:hypothetical protein